MRCRNISLCIINDNIAPYRDGLHSKPRGKARISGSCNSIDARRPTPRVAFSFPQGDLEDTALGHGWVLGSMVEWTLRSTPPYDDSSPVEGQFGGFVGEGNGPPDTQQQQSCTYVVLPRTPASSSGKLTRCDRILEARLLAH